MFYKIKSFTFLIRYLFQSQWTRTELQLKFHLANKQTLCTTQCKHSFININCLLFLFDHTQHFALNITAQLKFFVTLHKLEYLLRIFIKIVFVFVLLLVWARKNNTCRVMSQQRGERQKEKKSESAMRTKCWSERENQTNPLFLHCENN